MIDVKFCKDKKANAILITLLLLVSLVSVVLFILFLKDENFDLIEGIIHSIEIVIKFLTFLIVIDYIRIKNKK